MSLTGKPADMLKAGVVEPLRVKTQAISSAAEAAVMILRIDDVIASQKGSSPAVCPPVACPPAWAVLKNNFFCFLYYSTEKFSRDLL